MTDSKAQHHKHSYKNRYADDTQVYVYLYQKNTSAAFEQLNWCLDDVNKLMSTSKLKLNPDKSEFKETEG